MGRRRAQTETSTKYSNSLIYQLTNVFPIHCVLCCTFSITWEAHISAHNDEHDWVFQFWLENVFLSKSNQIWGKAKTIQMLLLSKLPMFQKPFKPPTLISILISLTRTSRGWVIFLLLFIIFISVPLTCWRGKKMKIWMRAVKPCFKDRMWSLERFNRQQLFRTKPITVESSKCQSTHYGKETGSNTNKVFNWHYFHCRFFSGRIW